MEEKIDAGIRMLKAQGHIVQPQVRGEGRMWFEVDRRMLVSREQIHDLAEGVYSLAGLEELFKQQQEAA